MIAAVVREPLYRTVPDCRESFGDLAAKVGVALGLPPDPEQQVALDAIFAERRPGIPRYRHACLIGARQNIKSSTLAVASATDLLVLGIPGAVWTAHQSKTATKSYEDLMRRIRSYPDFAEITDFRAGRGEETIYLPAAPEISLEFRARSGGSGRGFTTGRLTLDEALYLRAADVGALLPTMLTREDAQVRYGSSAGLKQSEVLRDLRDDGRSGRDPGLWYAEYGSERRPCASDLCRHEVGAEGCALDDRELWWQACSALWCGRITEASIADLRRRMPPEEFMREVLVWWDDPVSAGGVIDETHWLSLADPNAKVREPVAIGLDVDQDRVCSLGVAWVRADESWQVETIQVFPSTAGVVERCAEVSKRWDVPVYIGGPAKALEDDLREAGATVEIVSAEEFAQASAGLEERIRAGGVRHGNQAELNHAALVARQRIFGSMGEWAWQLKDCPGVGPLAAVTRATRGLARPSEPFLIVT